MTPIPTKPSNRKRYNSREDIEQEIFELGAQANRCEREANLLETQCREFFKANPNAHPQSMAVLNHKAWADEAKTLWGRASSIRESRIPALTRRLAEFQTLTMPFMPDNSIPK